MNIIPIPKKDEVKNYLTGIPEDMQDRILRIRKIVLGMNYEIEEAIKWKDCLTYKFKKKNIIQTELGKSHITLIFLKEFDLMIPKKY